MSEILLEWDEVSKTGRFRQASGQFPEAWRGYRAAQNEVLTLLEMFTADYDEDTRFSHGETRWNATGVCRDRILRVIYTVRNERVRVISARNPRKVGVSSRRRRDCVRAAARPCRAFAARFGTRFPDGGGGYRRPPRPNFKPPPPDPIGASSALRSYRGGGGVVIQFVMLWAEP